ncbi:hypothetical protein [Parasediminibacterium sp. JCM 36343]|uniref:hypothetical protein n=1 Tax=Parasediminibacterium sp. JCM 36343 TaxID=3374279 RepID=UPI00397D800C
MQIQVTIGFGQLVELAKQLPSTQWLRLKKEVEKATLRANGISEEEAFLLTTPTFTMNNLKRLPKPEKQLRNGEQTNFN